MNNFRKRIIGGFLSASFGQGVTIITQLVSVPLFLQYWGTELYGEWLIISAVPSYFAVSDFGFGSAASNDMIMRAARGDRVGAVETFHSISIFIILSSTAFVMCLMAFLAVVPFEKMLGIRQLSHAQAWFIVAVLSMHVIVSLQGKLFGAAFASEQRYPEGMFYGHVQRLLDFVAIAAILIIGGGPMVVVITYFAVRVLGLYAIWCRLRMVAPWLELQMKVPNVKRIKMLAIPSISFLCFPLGNALTLEGLVLVVGALLGPAAVVLYTTMRTLSRAALQIMQMINSTLAPEFSLAYGSKDFTLMRKLHRRACQISLWMTICVVAVLAIFGPSAYAIWTGGRLAIVLQVYLLLLLEVLLNAFWFTSSIVPAATNEHRPMALAFLVGSAACIVLAIPLAKIGGLTGVALSLVAVDAFMIMFTVRLSLRIVKDNGGEFLFAVLKLPLAFAVTEMRKITFWKTERM